MTTAALNEKVVIKEVNMPAVNIEAPHILSHSDTAWPASADTA